VAVARLATAEVGATNAVAMEAEDAGTSKRRFADSSLHESGL
jgi:hypothetical protein